MSNRKNLAFLRKRRIYLNAAISHGGGNRDHRAWQVEFNGPGIREMTGGEPFLAIHVSDCGGSGRWDGKRYCESRAVEAAMHQLADKLGLALPEDHRSF